MPCLRCELAGGRYLVSLLRCEALTRIVPQPWESQNDLASAAFTAALSSRVRESTELPAGLLGVEHEFSLRAGSECVDFRRLIHQLPVRGRRLDPYDPNAYRCRSGGALTCDGAEAEIATPPVRRRPGFTRAVVSWARSLRRDLEELLPAEVQLHGFSTHVSVAMPEPFGDVVCRVYARTFAPALMLLMDGPTSPGLLVRPRPGRVELCGEFVDGPRLGAVSAFAVGSVAACAAAVAGAREQTRTGRLPAPVRVSVEPAVERFGWYVDRRAVGVDLYAHGRQALLRRADGSTISAQEHLALAWEVARGALETTVRPEDLEVADRLVSGDLPLPVEAPLPMELERLPDAGGSRSSPVFGGVLERRQRPGFEITAVVATWDLTVFVLVDANRRTFACIPRGYLLRFLRGLDNGQFDDLLLHYLRSAPSGRVLERWDQTREPALFDSIGSRARLVPAERDPEGEVWVGAPARPIEPVDHLRTASSVERSAEATLGSTVVHADVQATVEEAYTRPGKRPAVIEESHFEPEHPGGHSWWLPLLGGLVVLALLGVFLVVINPFSGSQTQTTSTPAATAPATAAPPTVRPTVPTPPAAAAPAIQAGPITATLAAPVTTYVVEARSTSGGALAFTWSFQTGEPGCDDFKPGAAQAASPGSGTQRSSAQWNHPHRGAPPYRCADGTFHPGTITVAISDDKGSSVTRQYTQGSANGRDPEAALQ